MAPRTVRYRILRCGGSNKSSPFSSIEVTALETGEPFMSDAQVGLVMATPLIIIFAIMLYRMGVLRPTGTITAVTMSVVIAAVLFFTQ
ncbi:hypothetical protein [Microvirga guangxiensis]|nr:hypothetical protein [Microvirga guangxiensis]